MPQRSASSLLAVSAFILAACLSPLAAHAAEKWEAASTTAISITGDITLSDDKITFADGKTLNLRPLGGDKPGVYAIDPPENPTLLNGNKLCGDKPPTFIVAGRPNDDNLYLKVFDTDEAPAASNELMQPGMCAGYNFGR
ncbi:hypothetical protein V6C03_02535 [Methyloligella sp. 2.7D]|uniref:hypothetical protein n=1 Tax=unclassified Methyloligella TaxID=2625955 RepID=UPI00157D5D3A|nr:hypothetical protein [Methyloligella sp. GL2]QKP76496.1 hypothetical protein HT051_02885 [Methyloligella sp. GL2]